MRNLLRNSEYRNSLIKLAIITFFIFVVMSLMLLYFLNEVKRGILIQNAYTVGKLVRFAPELESEAASALLGKASSDDLQRGMEVLSHYGFKRNTLFQDATVLEDLWPIAAIGVLILALVFFLLLFMHTTRNYQHIYRKINQIATLSERVVEGDFSAKLPSEGEGSFAILGHRFNQMTNRLKLTLESLNHEKHFLRDIIADISHQLKTPLSTLIINHDNLLDNPGMDGETRQRFIQLSSQQLARLEWLIQSLLKMARLESGSITFKKDRVMLKKVLRAACGTMEPLARAAGVELSLPDCPEDAFCFGDEDWMQEAFVNIIKNCIEHTPPHGKVTARIFKAQLTSGVVISDNGEGIDKKDLPHIFKRFYRGESINKPSSIGIGLSLSKAIIEGLGGTIGVRSEKGNGADFFVTFFIYA